MVLAGGYENRCVGRPGFALEACDGPLRGSWIRPRRSLSTPGRLPSEQRREKHGGISEWMRADRRPVLGRLACCRLLAPRQSLGQTEAQHVRGQGCRGSLPVRRGRLEDTTSPPDPGCSARWLQMSVQVTDVCAAAVGRGCVALTWRAEDRKVDFEYDEARQALKLAGHSWMVYVSHVSCV